MQGDDRTFFGHPRGLFYLAFTEAWERFSFYGMTALLTLYMVDQLLLPGHVEHIVGFDGFRNALEAVTGPLSEIALASLIFGLYSGFVYFTPVFGGLIADRWLGQRNAVVLGALSMSADGLAEINPDRCIGCGLCVPACPAGALNLTAKPADQRRTPPATTAEQMKDMARARGL